MRRSLSAAVGWLTTNHTYQLAIVACLALLVTTTAQGQGKPAALKKAPPAAQEMFNDAGNFQNNKAFELAADEWSKFLKKYPDVDLAPKAQYYLGVCLLQLNKHTEAAAAFQAAVIKYPTLQTREDAYLNLGWCQYTLAGAAKENNGPLYDRAVATFAAMLKEFPKEKGKRTDQGYFFLGESYYALGKKKEAVAAYDPLVKDFAKSTLRADGVYALGTTHEELNQYPQAGAAYDIFLKEFDKHPLATEVRMRKAETILQAGLTAEKGGKADEAQPLFASAEKMFGLVAAVQGFGSVDHTVYRQAFSALKQNKFAEAGTLYAKIPTQFGKSTYVAEATISAARAFYQAEKFADSQTWFQKVIDTDGTDAVEAAHWICRIALRNKKPADAVALATKLLPKAAGNKYEVNLKTDLADALYELPPRRGEAFALYAKIATDHPKHEQAPQALYNAAFAALDLKKFDDGLKHTTTFLATYKEHSLTPDVKYVAAECNLLLNKHAQAETVYRDLIAKHADHTEIELWRLRFGLSLYLQKKYADTASTLTPLVGVFKTPANVAEGQFLIGASHFYLDKYPEAGKALTASLAADPKWRQADETLLLLSRSQRKTNQLDAAIKTVKQMLAGFADSKVLDQAHFRLGEYSYSAGDYKTATAEYDSVVTKWPASTFVPFAYYGKGWSQLKAKQYKPAVESFTALITKHADHQLIPEARFARAMSSRQTGDHKTAIADVNEYLKSNPPLTDKSNALFERGLAEVALKNHTAAATTFEALLKENTEFAAADKALYELAWAYKDQAKDEQAVANFLKLATTHGNSPHAAEALFHVGEDQYQKKQFAESQKSYALSKQKAGKNAIGEKATYKLGWSHYQQKQYDEALKQFADQTQNFAKGALAPDGQFMKAESLFKLENYKDAMPAYQLAKTATDAVESTPPEMKVLILLHGGQSAGQLKQWPESLQLLQAILVDHAKSAVVPEANFEIGRAQEGLNKTPEALASYEKAATESRGEVGARARFMIGEVYFKQKKYDEAIKQFQRTMFGYGGEKAAEGVKNWQAKSGYEAARCNDVQIQDATVAAKKSAFIADAIKYYSYVAEKHPKNSLVATAKKRAAELAKLK